MRRLLFSVLFAAAFTCASAYDFSYSHHFFVDDTVKVENTLYYAVNEDGKTATVVAGPEKYDYTRVEIPKTVENEGKTYTVTAIGFESFRNGKVGILSMPNTVTDILVSAFLECDIDSVAFSTGLKTIGDHAFSNSSIKSVYLHEGVTSIGYECFNNNYLGRPNGSIRVAELPNSLTSLGGSAFYGQEKMYRVKMPSKLKEIPKSAFEECDALLTIDLPEGLEKIGKYAFHSSGLREITFPSTLKEIGAAAFYACNLENVVLPNSVERFGTEIYNAGVFAENKNLVSCTWSTGATSIPCYIFSGCSKLQTFFIPTGVTSIGDSAFNGCTMLSSITLPESVTEVGNNAFSGSGLSTIQLPSALTYLPEHVFSDCGNLSTFTIPSSITEIKYGAFRRCVNLKNVVIPASVKTIEAFAFEDCGLTEIDIPESVTSIGGLAFKGCPLVEVTVPSAITELESAFSNCTKLQKVTLPKGLEKVGIGAFENCSALKELTFSSSLKEFGYAVFYGCTELTAVHVCRAIPPTITWHSFYKIISTDNQCVLYVPTGSKALYEQTDGYQNFKEIREENVDGTIYYQVAANVTSGNGRVLVNGNYNYSGKYETERQGNAVLTFEPSEGWMLGSVTVNGKNLTADVADNQLTLTSVEENMNVEVVFAEKPVVLTFKTAEGGAIGISVENGQSYTCHIQTEEGWKVNTVVFNGQDVTDQVVDNVFATPQLVGDALLSVSFESTDTKVRNLVAGSAMKAYADGEGRLCIDGTKAGEQVLVATADGQLLLNTKSHGDRITLPLVKQGVYVVTTQAKTVKVIF